MSKIELSITKDVGKGKGRENDVALMYVAWVREKKMKGITHDLTMNLVMKYKYQKVSYIKSRVNNG